MDEESKRPYVEMAKQHRLQFGSEKQSMKLSRSSHSNKMSHAEEVKESESHQSSDISEVEVIKSYGRGTRKPQVHSLTLQSAQVANNVEVKSKNSDSRNQAIVLNHSDNINDVKSSSKVQETKLTRQKLAVMHQGSTKAEETLISPQKTRQREFRIEKVPSVRKTSRVQKEGCQQLTSGSKFQSVVHLVASKAQQEPGSSSVCLRKDSEQTVYDELYESMDYSGVTTQIPCGNNKSLSEIVESTYTSPLSFLDQSRTDYVSQNDILNSPIFPMFNVVLKPDSHSATDGLRDSYDSNVASLLLCKY